MPRVHSKTNEELEDINACSTPNQGHSKKRHVCPTCDRCFTTSGHLARHSRVHTGEKNHKCPFPGCETRCSRQDNLQQHYRIHLSPGSRRTSSRSSASRRGKRTSTSDADQPPLSPPPLVQANISPSLSPPPLENARRAPEYSPPPDSPPPLAHATIYPRASPLSSGESSPQAPYPPAPSSFTSNLSMTPPPLAQANSPAPPYAYRSSTVAYQEQSGNNSAYTYSQNSPTGSESYSSDGYPFNLPRIEALSSQANSPALSGSSVSSRHSISHISHSQSQRAFPRMLSSMSSRPSTGPPSPASHASHSGPPTPTGYYDGDSAHSSPYDQGVSASSSDSTHSVILAPSLSRFTPPPPGPVLAPIQSFSSHDSTDALSRPTGVRISNEQYDRKSPARSDYDRYSHYETRYTPDEPRYGRLYGLTHGRPDISPVQNYMPHQPSPMYHDMYNGGNVSLSHGAWKSEHLTGRGMKSINALVQ